jgi:hypothetical protein
MDTKIIAKAKRRFYGKKSHTRSRKDVNGDQIEMRLTFDEWFKIWVDSGHYHEIGSRKGNYCMARHNDIGHYEMGNVSIILSSENYSAVGKSNFGRKQTQEHIDNRMAKVRAKKEVRDKFKKPPKVYVTPLGNFKNKHEIVIAFKESAYTIRKWFVLKPKEFYVTK